MDHLFKNRLMLLMGFQKMVVYLLGGVKKGARSKGSLEKCCGKD